MQSAQMALWLSSLYSRVGVCVFDMSAHGAYLQVTALADTADGAGVDGPAQCTQALTRAHGCSSKQDQAQSSIICLPVQVGNLQHRNVSAGHLRAYKKCQTQTPSANACSQ